MKYNFFSNAAETAENIVENPQKNWQSA